MRLTTAVAGESWKRLCGPRSLSRTAMTAQEADRAATRFGRDVHILAVRYEHLRQVVNDGRFPGTARPVNADEHASLMVRKGQSFIAAPSW